MALPLESEIMRQIGLGQHFNWHNDSGGCGYTAMEAARKLRACIQAQHDADPTSIAAPDMRLCDLADRAAVHDAGERYTLTTTWQVCSDVIQAHIHAAGVDDVFLHPRLYAQGWVSALGVRGR